MLLTTLLACWSPSAAPPDPLPPRPAPVTSTTCVPEPERCDGADDDCDGEVDEEPVDAIERWRDLDGDGHGAGGAVAGCSEPGWVDRGDDCDDSDAEVHPSAHEYCDRPDADCDPETAALGCDLEPCVWVGGVRHRGDGLPLPDPSCPYVDVAAGVAWITGSSLDIVGVDDERCWPAAQWPFEDLRVYYGDSGTQPPWIETYVQGVVAGSRGEVYVLGDMELLGWAFVDAYDRASGRRLGRVWEDWSYAVGQLERAPDGALWIATDAGVQRVDLGAGTWPPPVSVVLPVDLRWMPPLAAGPDGRMYVLEGEPRAVRRYLPDGTFDGVVGETLPTHALDLLVLPDGRLLVALEAGVVRTYDLASGARLPDFAQTRRLWETERMALASCGGP